MSEFNLSHSQVASRPLDGTYTLSFNSNTTTPLAHDATPDEVGFNHASCKCCDITVVAFSELKVNNIMHGPKNLISNKKLCSFDVMSCIVSVYTTD